MLDREAVEKMERSDALADLTDSFGTVSFGFVVDFELYLFALFILQITQIIVLLCPTNISYLKIDISLLFLFVLVRVHILSNAERHLIARSESQ